MSYVKTGTQELRNLEAEVRIGQIKIPQFQRDFVWDLEKAANLIDSMIRGYPIGSLIYWRTAEKLRDIRDLGRIEFGEANEGERVNYVLDGQQRLTSILAALLGLKVTLKDGGSRDFSGLTVHLNRVDEDLPIINRGYPEDDAACSIPLVQLWERKGDEYDCCSGDQRTIRDELSDRLRTYVIPVVTLHEADLSVATEVFTRTNTGAEPLSLFEIMVAKTYDPTQEFDLVEKFGEFHAELERSSFDSVQATHILQLIALMLRDDCKDRTILNIDRNDFIKAWPNAINNMRLAIDHIRTSLQIPVSRLLPYPALAVVVAVFFHLNGGKPPNGNQAKLLADFFWKAGWSERYSSAAGSKLAQDKATMARIQKGKRTRFDWAEKIEASKLEDAWFSVSQAFSKTILALLATSKPRKYDSGDLVNLRNDWMHRANSMNFHHVFPKAFLKKEGYEDWEINRVLNISLVDDFLNKRVIGARSPSDYMEEFYDQSENFDETMQTHLIRTDYDDDDEDQTASIWFDDYDSFLEERVSDVLELLKEKVL